MNRRDDVASGFNFIHQFTIATRVGRAIGGSTIDDPLHSRFARNRFVRGARYGKTFERRLFLEEKTRTKARSMPVAGPFEIFQSYLTIASDVSCRP